MKLPNAGQAIVDTAPLEAEINARVYRLYALTPDEIKLVEERTP